MASEPHDTDNIIAEIPGVLHKTDFVGSAVQDIEAQLNANLPESNPEEITGVDLTADDEDTGPVVVSDEESTGDGTDEDDASFTVLDENPNPPNQLQQRALNARPLRKSSSSGANASV